MKPPAIEVPRAILWTTKAKKYFMFCGHETYMHEICRIFGIHKSTLISRIESGWPMEAVVTAEGGSGWSKTNAWLLAEHPDVKRYCQTLMDEYFAEKEKFAFVAVESDAGKQLTLPTKIHKFMKEKPVKK